MRRAPSIGWAAAGLSSVALLGTAVLGVSSAAFTSEAGNPGNTVTAAADFRAPTVSSTVIGKASGDTPAFIKQGASYYVYANVSDTGNPASGIASVTADVSAISLGQSSVTLTSGSYSAGGTSYNHRSAALTANAVLPEGSTAYSISATDNDSNSGTQGGFTVTVDNTPPAASDVQTANAGGGTAGKAEAGDTLTLSYSEEIEPGTVLSGWNGSSTNVVVRIVNGGLLGSDELRIYNSADSGQLPLGVVDLGRTDYVGGVLGGEIARFGATGTASTMAKSGANLTIALGTHSGQSATTAGGNGTVLWTPSTTPTDRAGNAALPTPATEGGAADKEF
jgi:hypothetical protein